jgi:hypothetical protein
MQKPLSFRNAEIQRSLNLLKPNRLIVLPMISVVFLAIREKNKTIPYKSQEQKKPSLALSTLAD